ncbi:MAG TPA: energy-coupling factor transporter transmembrane protein EcfT, partial [Candidatus Aphodousia gallistercoris]|nr:energy-coupling factor transporter transmembrane protein EcfT [Candidatus Aphodousia gallistercoris]
MQETLLTLVDARSKLILILLGALGTIGFSTLSAQAVLFAATLALALTIRKPALLAVLYLMMAAMMA